jgi:tryptophan-rich sensory protein
MADLRNSAGQGPGGRQEKHGRGQSGFSSLPVHRQLFGLLTWLALVFLAAAAGGLASANAGDFYGQLVRPDWAPPGWLFGPVWGVLYLAMGIAAWLVWRVGGFRAARGALWLFIIQLAANALWTWLFFVWRQGALAFAEILCLWVLILATLIAFHRVRPLAGILLFPYLAWVSFAGLLSYVIWQLNPQLLA